MRLVEAERLSEPEQVHRLRLRIERRREQASDGFRAGGLRIGLGLNPAIKDGELFGLDADNDRNPGLLSSGFASALGAIAR